MTPGQETRVMAILVQILSLLLSHRSLLSPTDLVLPWRPLYALFLELSGHEAELNLKVYPPDFNKSLTGLVKRARLYFPAAATEEILPTLKLLANNIFEPLRENHPEPCKDAYELTWRLLSGVTRLAGQVIVTDSTPNLYRTEFSKEAGRKSGEARSKFAQETWQPHAEKLASEIIVRKISKKLTQDYLVEQIRSNWRLSTPKPSHSHLKKFVAQNLKVWLAGTR